MTFPLRWLSPRVAHAIGVSLNRATDNLSIYLVGAILTIGAAISILLWPSHFRSDQAAPLSFRVIEARHSADLSVENALRETLPTQSTLFRDTARSELPFWLVVDVMPTATFEQRIVEFPSRHAREITCWEAQTKDLIGYADRLRASGKLFQINAGFAVRVETGMPNRLLCKMTFSGPARITAQQWNGQSIYASTGDFGRKSGLIEGGIFMLAVFMLVTAALVRDRTYVIYGMWLILNARMAALSIGADHLFLGNTIPADLLLRTRIMTTALFSLCSVSLMLVLFRRELSTLGIRKYAPYLQLPALVLVTLSFVLPYQHYLPILWLHTIWMAIVMSMLMYQIITKARSTVAIFCGLAALIAISTGIAEVLSAAYGWRWVTDSLNSMVGAMLSSIMCTLSVAEHFRLEQKNRLHAQEVMERTIDAIPVGLFALDVDGTIVSANPTFLSSIGARRLTKDNNRWDQHFSEGSLPQLLEIVQLHPNDELIVHGIDNTLVHNESRQFIVRAALTNGRIEGYLQDITERERALSLYRHLASHDSLAGCLNRRGAQDAFTHAMADVAAGRPGALLYMRLTDIRSAQEVYGSSATDEVLRQVVATITNTLGVGHSIARIGYDNFAVILSDTVATLSLQLGETLQLTMDEAMYRVHDKVFHAHATICLLELRPDTDWENALRICSRACSLYATPHSRLVCLRADSPELRALERRSAIGELLQKRLMPDGSSIELRPTLSVINPFWAMNAEVCLTVPDEAGAKGVFAAAIEYELTGFVDMWMITQTFRWVETNLHHLARAKFISIPIHAASLRDEHLLNQIQRLFVDNRNVAEKLYLNIPAAAALEDIAGATMFIDKVADLGLRCILSQFGAGSMALNGIVQLPAVALKLDPSILTDGPLVDAIISLAENRGMLVIADGVDHTVTAEMLVEAGVRYLQGDAVAPLQRLQKMAQAESFAEFVNTQEILDLMLEFDDLVVDTVYPVDLSRY